MQTGSSTPAATQARPTGQAPSTGPMMDRFRLMSLGRPGNRPGSLMGLMRGIGGLPPTGPQLPVPQSASKANVQGLQNLQATLQNQHGM